MDALQLVTLQAGVGGPWRLPEVGSGQFSIGRKACCQLNLPESYAYVSGEHCRLKSVEQGGERLLVLEDLSGNGTFINGIRVGRGKTQTVNLGDEISLAKPTRKGGAIMFRVQVLVCEAPAWINPAEAPTVLPEPVVPPVPAPAVPAAVPAAPAEIQAPSTEAPVALAAAMAREGRQRQEERRQLEERIAAEKVRCAELETELQETRRCLLEERKATGRMPPASLRRQENATRDCEELRAALQRIAEERQPLEKAQQAALEAAKDRRRQCDRLRAELEEEQKASERAASEASALRSEVQEAESRAATLEVSVRREAEVNAALEEQAAAACAEWCRSRDAVTLARKRLEDRGAAYNSLRTAVWDYHQKVSRRLSALEQVLLEQAPAGESSTVTDAAQLRGARGSARDGEASMSAADAANAAAGARGGVAVHVGSSMDDETPTQDADVAAGVASGLSRSQGSQPEAKRPRR